MTEEDQYKSRFDNQPLHRMLGITLIERRPGFARICIAKTEKTPTGIGGSVHGGILAAMVDIAMLQALFVDLKPDEQPAGTADLSITYMRPSHGERIFADANVIKKGRQIAVVEVDIIDDRDRLCARGRVLYAFRRG